MRALGLAITIFSPGLLLPATSIVATIAGIVMIFGRRTLMLMIRTGRRRWHPARTIAGTSKPHLHIHDDVRTQFSDR